MVMVSKTKIKTEIKAATPGSYVSGMRKKSTKKQNNQMLDIKLKAANKDSAKRMADAIKSATKKDKRK
jgi:hypothetical protein